MKKLISILLVTAMVLGALSIVSFAEEGATPTPTATPTATAPSADEEVVLGKTFVMNNSTTESNKGAVGSVITDVLWTKEDLDEDGMLNIAFTIKNNGEDRYSIRAGLAAVACEQDGVDAFADLWNTGMVWTTIGNLEGGETRDVQWQVGPFVDGVFTDSNGVDWKIEDLFLRVQTMDAGTIAIGTSFSIWCENEEDYNALLKTFTNKNTTTNPWTITDYTVKKSAIDNATPTPVPKQATGIAIELLEDIEATGSAYCVTSTGGGTFKASQVKKGVLTLKYPVTNNGTENVAVAILFEVINQNAGWSDFADFEMEYILIEPGKTQWLALEVPVSDDNTIDAMDGNAYDITKWFLRFNFRNEDAADDPRAGMPMDKGVKLVIGGSAEDYQVLKKIGINIAWKMTDSYVEIAAKEDSGDAFSIMTYTVLSVVLLSAVTVIIIKKRKEN